MSHPLFTPRLLLVGVAAVLGLLVGLVGAADRKAAGPHGRSLTSRALEEEREELDELRMPLIPEPAASEPEPARESRPRPRLARISGSVARPGGEPAANARIVLGDMRAACDAEGRFELALEPPAPAADLVAFEPGFEPVLRPSFGASLAAGGETRLDLVLGPPTLTLAGRVVDLEGGAVEGWTVELDEPDLLRDLDLCEPVKCDAEGRFVLPDVPVGLHVVRTFHERRELAVRSSPVEAGTSEVSIVVDPDG